MNGLTGIAGCDRPHQPRDWGNGTEQADALESPIQSELRGKIIGGDPVIRVVMPGRWANHESEIAFA